jgi:hypothetical protein
VVCGVVVKYYTLMLKMVGAACYSTQEKGGLAAKLSQMNHTIEIMANPNEFQ